jgi:hypothetical protein
VSGDDEALLFREADGGKGAAGALALVGGDGRPHGGLAKLACAQDELTDLGAEVGVEGDADGDVVGVVADAALRDGTPAILFEEEGVGGDLDGVRWPGLGLAGRASTGAAALPVEGAAGVDEVVGEADLLDFFEVVEPFAVGQAVERHDADEGVCG